MVEARLFDLKRCCHIEDCTAPLDGHHPAGSETLAVAYAFYVVNDRLLDVALPEKISVQAMGLPFRWHGLVGGRKCLSQYLPAVDVAKSQVLALPAEDVLLDLLELQ